MTLVLVRSEEVEQRLQAVLVAEHDRREVAVEELHPVPDGGRPAGPGEGRIEGLEVQLEHVQVVEAVEQGRM